MSGSDPTKTKMAARLAAALERWESEGGAPRLLSQVDRDRAATVAADAGLAGEERRVLLCLGAAVIMLWNDLPQDTQRAVFERAVSTGGPGHTAELKPEIARFLHRHKDDERSFV